jgi:hypothetical protein
MDVMLMVPELLLQDLKPKPRDTWTDKDGTVWTVLEASFSLLHRTWRLTSRDLVIVNELHDLITIERPAITRDLASGIVRTFAAIYTGIPARVQPINAATVEERALRGFDVTHEVYLSQQLTILDDDRMNFGGTLYDIKGYHNPVRIDELMVLEVQLKP